MASVHAQSIFARKLHALKIKTAQPFLENVRMDFVKNKIDFELDIEKVSLQRETFSISRIRRKVLVDEPKDLA